jgi:hypothetical protein
VSKYRDNLTPEQQADLDRLTALRESGYTGPVNQDGLPAIAENTDRGLWNLIQAARQHDSGRR